MTVIEASSGTYRSRVDGTIVLSVEIEPRFRAEAIALFGMPGTPMALAALKVGKAKEDRPKAGIGQHCLEAVTLCRDPQFLEWVSFASLGTTEPVSEANIAAMMRRVCKVESRKDLDTDPEALKRFQRLILEPYRKWSKVPA